MNGKTTGPLALAARLDAAARAPLPTLAATSPIKTVQRRQWATGIGLFALSTVLIALLAWPAGTWLQTLNPQAAAPFWLLVFALLLAVLVALIRVLTRLPAFRRANRACAARHLQLWMPSLGKLLDNGETVIGAVYAPCFDPGGRGHGWINALLVWTSRRLLLVPAYPTDRALPIWSLWLAEIATIRVATLRGGWLRWLQGPVEQIEITEGSGRRTCIVAGNPADSGAIVDDLIETAMRRTGDGEAKRG